MDTFDYIPVRDTYHICTGGLSRNMIFKDRNDFINGMNDIPISMNSCEVKIYGFCLMSNHVHFIMKGNAEDCYGFIRKYKRLRTMRLQKKYGAAPVTGDADVSLHKINDNEYFMNVIAYVMRNPVAAGLKVMPGEYPWSSACLYFADKSLHGNKTYLKDFKNTDIRKMFGSRAKLPGDYTVNSENMILPENYVDYRSVEKYFITPKRLMYYLSKNNDAQMEIENTPVLSRVIFQDHELIPQISEISASMFGKPDFRELDLKSKCIVAKELHRRFGSNAKQISRLTGIPSDIIRTLL